MKRLTGNGIATGLAYYERLRDIENILGDEYDLDLLQKQIQAYREGRCSGNCETLNCGDCGILDKIVDRLAAYEDTGLEPCDYSAMAHALKQAERAREDLTEMIRQIGATGLDRLRELAWADKLIGKPVWLTKWFTKNVQIANPPLQRTIIYISVCKNEEILMHIKDGAFPIQLIGDCAFTSQEEAQAALRREQDGE